MPSRKLDSNSITQGTPRSREEERTDVAEAKVQILREELERRTAELREAEEERDKERIAREVANSKLADANRKLEHEIKVRIDIAGSQQDALAKLSERRNDARAAERAKERGW